MTRYTNSKKGFTLIETLIYIALYSIIIGGAIVAIYTIFESAGRNQTKAMLEEEGMFLTGKVNWALSGAAIINTPEQSATSSRLSITKYDSTTVVVTISATGTITMMQNGGHALPLNNTNTEVTGLEFTHLGTPREGLRASFTLSARAPNGMSITQEFSTTQYLRN